MLSVLEAAQLWTALEPSQLALGKTSWGASKTDQSARPPSPERSPGRERVWISSPCRRRVDFFVIIRFVALLVLLGIRVPLAALAPARFFLDVLLLHSVGH